MASSLRSVYPATAAIIPGDCVQRYVSGFQITSLGTSRSKCGATAASHSVAAMDDRSRPNKDFITGGRARLMSFICALALVCAAGMFFQLKAAHAQCAAQDVTGNRHLLDDSSFSETSEIIQSAADIPVWKTIKVGTITSKWDLLRQLDAAHCGVGDGGRNPGAARLRRQLY